MTTKGSNNPFPSVLLNEVATDGSDTGTPAADYRRLFLGEDGTLHLKDSAAAVTDVGGGALTDHTHAVTGSGATGGGPTLAPTTLTLPTVAGTAEGRFAWDATNDNLKVYDGQRDRGIVQGWAPWAFPAFYDPGAAFSTALALAANGGSLAVPMIVPAHMLLQDVVVRNTDTASARTWGWDLYLNRLNNANSGENTADRVAASSADESFTASAASNRFVTAGSAPVYLPPGVYWLVLQCRHATNTFGVGTTAQGTGSVGTAIITGQTKTTTNPNGSTLDLVAATWTKQATSISVAMRGRVLGMTGAQ